MKNIRTKCCCPDHDCWRKWFPKQLALVCMFIEELLRLLFILFYLYFKMIHYLLILIKGFCLWLTVWIFFNSISIFDNFRDFLVNSGQIRIYLNLLAWWSSLIMTYIGHSCFDPNLFTTILFYPFLLWLFCWTLLLKDFFLTGFLWRLFICFFFTLLQIYCKEFIILIFFKKKINPQPSKT